MTSRLDLAPTSIRMPTTSLVFLYTICLAIQLTSPAVHGLFTSTGVPSPEGTVAAANLEGDDLIPTTPQAPGLLSLLAPTPRQLGRTGGALMKAG